MASFWTLVPLLLVALVGARGSELAADPNYFAPQVAPLAQQTYTSNFLSATLGSNMVLQCGPAAVVWGFVNKSGTEVTTTINGKTALKTTAGADGVWRQRLPAVPCDSPVVKLMANGQAHMSLAFTATSGETAQMDNVLYGDVFLCGGQSNMQFAVPNIANASAEIARAENYPSIRLFTVGQKTSSRTPLNDLQTIEQPWSVASSKTVAGNGGFGYFSAVCWIFGRQVYDGLGGDRPIGLINNNWGGTPVESWTTPETLQACNVSTVDSILYNAMINPYVVGPMVLSGFTWYQGEANVDERRGDEGAVRYSCTFPGMIEQWRRAFQAPDAYFGFVQLSTWCGNNELIAEMRTIGQMAALKLPNVGYSTNSDHGAGCNIHPPPKQYCAQRLANSALALHYGKPIAWKSPSFGSQKCDQNSVTVKLNDVSSAGLRDDQYPFNYLDGTFNCTQYGIMKCAWAAVMLSNGQWVNATISVAGPDTVTLSPPKGQSAPVASRYAWGAVPMMNLYDKQTGLPVLAWSENCTST